MIERICQCFCVWLIGIVYSTNSFAGLDEGNAANSRGDFATAVREYKPLAERGNAQAQANLAMLYFYGDGVPKDYDQGLKWLRLAAGQNLPFAQSNLGSLYAQGIGVKKDYKESVLNNPFSKS